jgi:4-amino-4-deoxy-L-arabinose transferase-like glycosyltransferase
VTDGTGAPSTAAPWRILRDFLVIAALVLPLLLALGMMRGLNHDEHQHVAAGALFAREGLLPYLDFPHFHTPYLVFVYGLLFQTTDHLMLAARLFSVACASASIALVGAITAHLFRPRGGRLATFTTIGAVLLMLSAAVFTRTVGRAWNHEPALLLALVAFVAHAAGVRRAHGGWIFAGAVLLGLAIGVRITYAPLLAPFGLALLFLVKGNVARKAALIGWSAAGFAVSLAGVAWLAWLAPEQAWFGNFEFAKVNITYRFATGEPRTMTVPTKLRFLWKEIIRYDLGLFFAFLAPLAAVITLRRTRGTPLSMELVFLLLTLPFLLFGSFAPSPVFEQYFYPFVLFLLLGAAYAFACLPSDRRWYRPVAAIAGAGVLLSVARGAAAYRDLPGLFRPHHWTPVETHAEAGRLRIVPPPGRILTLAPIQAVEAGRPIYPEFASGPFAWRVSSFVEPAKAARLKIPTVATLEALLGAHPPAAFLLGIEKNGEDEFKRYAKAHGYRIIPPATGDELWVRR